MLISQRQNFFIIYLFLIFVVVVIILQQQQTALAQQSSSIVWDEATKSWVSAPPTTAPTPTVPQPLPTPTQQPTTIYQQQPQQPTTTIPTTVTPAQSTVDLGTLATVVGPIIAGIAGIFLKNRKDMEKKDEEVKQDTINTIKQAIVPYLKQITPVAETTAKQDVKINQIADELYKVMADKANEIHDKPEIQQQKLIEDAVRSEMIAKATTKAEPKLEWDEKSKSWVSK